MNRITAALTAGIATLALLGATTAASADPPRGHNPPGQYKKKGKSDYRDRGERDGGREYRYPSSRRYGGPPPWAPAYGYRAKHRFKYHYRGRERYATTDEIVVVPQAGIGSCNREIVGGLLGGAAGGALGSQIGGGSGKTAAVIGGAILGVLVGGSIGRSLDRIDQNCVGQTLERAPTGQPVVWNNPDQGGQVQVTPTRTYQQTGGRYCREYQTEIIVGGRVESGYGTACRQPDGSWQTAN